MFNKIIQGGAATELKRYDDKCIDLTVTSPPYDDIRYYSDEFTSAFDRTVDDFEAEAKENREQDNKKPKTAEKLFKRALSTFKRGKIDEKLKANNGYSFPFEQIADELYRVTKDGGTVVWVVGDAVVNGSETGSSFRQALYFQKIGFKLHDTMIYEKNGSSFPARRDGNRYSQIFEYMFVFTKGAPNKQKTKLICDKKNKWSGWTTFGKVGSMRGKDGKLVERKQKPVPEFSPRNNIWRYNTGKSYSTKDKIAFEHPAIFPESLAEDHILSWTEEGDVVLDPFIGSGTTSKMAHLNGRQWLGIDISEKYCGIARERMEIAENLRSGGYKNRYETMTITSRDTITSDGKLSHKEISDMKKPELFALAMKWNDELVELRKYKERVEMNGDHKKEDNSHDSENKKIAS